MIILARHGRTVFNEAGRYQGACDSPLTEVGVKQAEQVGVAVRSLVVGGVCLWSSPLGRALSSARIVREVAHLSCDPRIDQRLREISVGSWDGLTDEEIEHVSPGACDGATHFDWFFRSPDGESFEAAETRLSLWLAEVEAAGGCHIAISHGLSGRILRGAYLGLSKGETLRLDVPQGAVHVLANGRCELVCSAN